MSTMYSTNACGADIFAEPLASCTAEDILAHYQARTAPKYFPVVDEAEAAGEKIENLLGNLFEFNNESYQLPAVIDWTRNPSPDVEWLILFHKFYYAAGLGLMYDQTKDRRYSDKWIALTESWIDAVPVGFLSSDVAGRRIQNWISAHYYFVTQNRTPGLDGTFYVKFLESIHRQVCHLRQHLTPARNHRSLELYAILLAAIVFPELKGADEWLDFSRRELLKNMQTDLLPDGVQCELSLDYHHIVLKNYMAARRLCSLNGLTVPEEMDALLQKALSFSLFAHTPAGVVPAISDADRDSFLNLLEQGHQIFGSEEMSYVASGGRSGKPPSEKSKSFPNSGYYILRSGWGERAEPYEDERYLILDCGPLGAGNHGHLDLLSFEMAAYGRSLVVDPGRYTYDESGDTNWRALFRSTGYHNTVRIDGKNQTRYECRKNRFRITGPAPQHEVRAFVTQPEFDYVRAVAHSHEYDVIHEREILFLHGTYWIILDRLQADQIHNYDLLFHLSEEASGRVSSRSHRDTLTIESPHLVIAQPSEPDVSHSVESGYVSPKYGVKHAAPIVRLARRAASARFCTVLYPFKEERPEVLIGSREGSLHVTVALGGRLVTGCFLFDGGFQSFQRRKEGTRACRYHL